MVFASNWIGMAGNKSMRRWGVGKDTLPAVPTQDAGPTRAPHSLEQLGGKEELDEAVSRVEKTGKKFMTSCGWLAHTHTLKGKDKMIPL